MKEIEPLDFDQINKDLMGYELSEAMKVFAQLLISKQNEIIADYNKFKKENQNVQK